MAVREGHRGLVTGVAFSPDGRCLLTCSADQTVRVWDAATGGPLGVLHGHTGADRWSWYTADGRTILTVSFADATVRQWDARAAEWNGALRGHTDFAYDAAVHPDGERVASCRWDGTVRVWDAGTGRETAVLTYPFDRPVEQPVVSGVAFHPAGRLVAAGGRDGGWRPGRWTAPSACGIRSPGGRRPCWSTGRTCTGWRSPPTAPDWPPRARTT